MQDYFLAPAPTAPPRPNEPAPAAVVRRRSVVVPTLAVVLGVALAVGGTLLVRSDALKAAPELTHVDAPAPASAGWGPSWMDAEGRPARWDPCEPIGYVVNPQWMPHEGRADLAEALRRVSAVSGLRFVDEGDTTELPARDRAAYQPDRYGQRWAPLLVAWVPPQHTDLGLGADAKGVAMSVAVAGHRGGSIVTAQVALDADRRLSSGFGPGATEGEVLLHELAHAVGLGHVDDPTQVMYFRTTNSESEFGAGDRAGLTALGASAGCLPAPKPRALRFDG